ncbi:hypothetical protein [Heyndrickxia oleronia]|uniref:Uncharacterized protein n=1 Tax=Heyndrickxia oleronia TaxID=38875 RepID=A0AAW6T557_9BACI|nr:hypothetical protein [Heyndrickxia oleronia]MDH5164487.1 hypothetical protein [Heyndrickxia oleronia]GIN41478.1 hypothetical protein J19TS1_44270 [Heyndrickxia oleronia]
MPSIQDTIYPRFKSNLTDKDLEEVYTPQMKEIEWAEAKSGDNIGLIEEKRVSTR